MQMGQGQGLTAGCEVPGAVGAVGSPSLGTRHCRQPPGSSLLGTVAPGDEERPGARQLLQGREASGESRGPELHGQNLWAVVSVPCLQPGGLWEGSALERLGPCPRPGSCRGWCTLPCPPFTGPHTSWRESALSAGPVVFRGDKRSRSWPVSVLPSTHPPRSLDCRPAFQCPA